MSDGATVSYAPNDLNQYGTVNGSSVGYGPSGNLTSYGGWIYGHDADNRLISAIGGGHTVTFVYDGLGRCMQRTLDGVTTSFSYDGWQAIAEWSELGSRDIDGWAGRPSERARASQWDSAGVRTAWNMSGWSGGGVISFDSAKASARRRG